MLALVTLASLVALSAQASVLPLKKAVNKRWNTVQPSGGGWKWKETDIIFSFGDSYTASYTAEEATPPTYELGGTSANGPNWIQYLTTTYNVSSPVLRYNIAAGGATVDSAVIPPFSASVKSIKDQVDRFVSYAESGATWDQQRALCSVWIGTNDVGNSYKWTNVSFPDLYATQIDILRAQATRVQSYNACGAWLFLSVPPLGAAPLHAPFANLVNEKVGIWNSKLGEMAEELRAELNDTTWVGVFDTGKVFTALIENADALGFTNVTGYNDAYPVPYGFKQLQPAGNNTQIEPFLPLSSYFWGDNLHPTWPVHNHLAHSLATYLAGVNVVST